MEIVNAPVRVEIIARTRIDWDRLEAVLEERGLRWSHDPEWPDETPPLVNVNGTEGALLAEYAGRGCYNSFGGTNGAGMGRGSNAEYVDNLIRSGHGSVFEHVSFTFALWSISRGLTHELVRHRVGVAISQASTRFRDESRGRFIVPTLLRRAYEEDPTIVQPLLEAAEQAARSYDELLDILRDRKLVKAMGLEGTAARKAARGIARACLPIGLESPMTWTANVRMLWTVMDQRGSPHAEAEIREMAVAMHRLLVKEEPALFGHLEEYQLQDGTYAIRKRQDSVDGFDRAPDRYSATGREAIDQIRDGLGDVGFIAFCLGNEMKYRARAGLKGDATADEAKAAWYSQMADHVATGSPDPRHLRPGFVPYTKA